MIVHSVKFDRPVSNVRLVENLVPADRHSDAAAHPAQVSASAESASTSVEADSVGNRDNETVSQLLNKIAQGIHRLQSQTGNWVGEIQAIAIQLSSLIVTQLIGSSEAMRIQRLEGLLREALNRTEAPIQAFIHPDDFSKLTEYLTSLDLDVQPDVSINLGECRVDFQSHELVSSLPQQLIQIEDLLREAFQND
jgi:flagellar biosynthesis/type III secretory pathway protein FliH